MILSILNKMASPTEIIEDLGRGKAYFANINALKIQKRMDGCSGCGCGDELWECLYETVKSLEMRVEQNIFDVITDKLHHKMMLLIGDLSGSGPTPNMFAVDFGYSDIDYTGNYGAIPFQFSKQYAINSATITLDYTLASQGKFLFFRVRTGFPLYYKWQIDADEYEMIPGFQWRDPETNTIYDYYLSRQPIYLNPGKTSITYLGNVIASQPLIMSYDPGIGSPAVGVIQVLDSSSKIVYNLGLNESITINRPVTKVYQFKNTTNKPVYLYINTVLITTLDIDQVYELPDTTSTVIKVIKFIYS